MKLSKFWKKVAKCTHKNLSKTYYETWYCDPELGCHASEEKCLDCGVYISDCGCGSEQGIYGWPRKRRSRLEMKRKYKITRLDPQP